VEKILWSILELFGIEGVVLFFEIPESTRKISILSLTSIRKFKSFLHYMHMNVPYVHKNLQGFPNIVMDYRMRLENGVGIKNRPYKWL